MKKDFANVTTDLVTKYYNNISLMDLTVFFIASNLIMYTHLQDCTEFDDQYTGENIHQITLAYLEELGLSEDVTPFTTNCDSKL